MKIFMTSIVYGGAVFLLIYLIGAFVFADLNIANWSTNARIVVGFGGGGIALSIMGASIDILSNKNK